MNNIVVRNASIFKKNFSGKEIKPYNPEGARNFMLSLSSEDAQNLINEGWNVKAWENSDGDIIYSLPVAVRYDVMPPEIYMVTSSNKTLLTEELVGNLDAANFDKIDLVIHPSQYTVHGRQGVKAYLKKGYFTIQEDDLDLEYADLPFSY